MKVGAEPKKVALLVGLVGVIVYGIATWNSGDAPSPAPVARTPAVVEPVIPVASSATGARTRTSGRGSAEFHPRLGGKPEDRVDPASINPELRLDLLAKVEAVEPVAAGRNLFQFGPAPAPVPAIPTNVPKIPVNQPSVQQVRPVTPPPQQPQVPVTPAAPQAPPITLRYFGYKVAKVDGRMEAFLLDGEEILRAGENDVLKQRYRIVKIARTAITIEDTQFKSTQTLTLQEPQG